MLMCSQPVLRVRCRDVANLTSLITHPVGTDAASMTDSNSSARDAARISQPPMKTCSSTPFGESGYGPEIIQPNETR
jgi:hypothetical protein